MELISRQAAIEALGEEPSVWFDNDADIAERNQWKTDVAALMAVPSVDDLISRQAAIEALGEEPYVWDDNDDYTRGERAMWKMTFDAIEALSPAQPKRRAVIYSGDGYADGHMVYDLAECPACGYEYEEGDMSWGEPYCPHCGQSLNWDTEGDWKWMILSADRRRLMR